MLFGENIFIHWTSFFFSEQTNHFADSIVTYFDTALSTMLLYAVERTQYKQVIVIDEELNRLLNRFYSRCKRIMDSARNYNHRMSMELDIYYD